MEFFLLQKPTRLAHQSFFNISDKKVYKGPYPYEKAQQIIEKYSLLESIGVNVIVPKLVNIVGPGSESKKNYFLKSPFLGTADEYQIVEDNTKFGISKRVVFKTPIRYVSIEQDPEEILLELIKSGIARICLGIGDSARRNFIVHNHKVYQINLDSEISSPPEEKNILDLCFKELTITDKARLKKVYEEHKIEIVKFIRIVSDEINVRDEIFNILMKDISVLDIVVSTELESDLLEKYPTFKLPEEDISKFPKSVTDTAYSFVIAFLGVYNYGFYSSSRKNFSMTLLYTSIYTGILEDLSIYDIVRYGPKIINLLEKLRGVAEKGPQENLSLPFNIAFEIYQYMADSCKTRELSFWIMAGLSPETKKLDHSFANRAYELSLELKGKDINFSLLKKYHPKEDWIWEIGRNCHKMIRRLIYLSEYLKMNIEIGRVLEEVYSPSKITKRDIQCFKFINPETPEPCTVFKKQHTGIQDCSGRMLSLGIAKSILQKSFRVGLPLRNLVRVENFKLGRVLSFKIHPHYYHHEKNSEISETTGFILFFKKGFRSLNAGDISIGETNLYRLAMSIYLKMNQLSLKESINTLTE